MLFLFFMLLDSFCFSQQQKQSDTVKITRKELILFAEKSEMLKWCRQNEEILVSQIAKCENLSAALEQDISKKNLIIKNDSIIISNQSIQMNNLASKNERITRKNKLILTSLIAAVGAAIFEAFLLIK